MARKTVSKVIFVDTNIYLDFYRIRNEMSLKFLQQLGSLKKSIVMTYQVEMEFKKNRQAVILETLKSLTVPPPIAHPVILSEATACRSLKKAHDELKQGVKDLASRLQTMLREPGLHDTVYATLQRLFTKDDELTLREESSEKAQVIERAHSRFLLGFPPRKNTDNSIGDAVNWEWLIHLASKKPLTIYIVSRDGDYGAKLEQEHVLNDWLKDEFERRTKKGTSIHLRGTLSNVLKEFSVPVSKAQELAERAVVCQRRVAKMAEHSGKYIDYLRKLDKDTLEQEVDCKLAETSYLLMDDDTMCSLMAETNAGPWYIDEYEILGIEVASDSASVKISFHATGEPDWDRPFCGDEISGTAEAMIDEQGDIAYKVIKADIGDWGE